jgi:hypothetical protein
MQQICERRRSPAQFRLVYRRHGEPIVTEQQWLDQSDERASGGITGLPETAAFVETGRAAAVPLH